jgi:23S rRNA (uracil1939-C5)-methyltransferase
MDTGRIFRGKIEKLAAGGAGILKFDGKTVFMEGTAPGDLVAGRIVSGKGAWARGELLEILDPSPMRTEPRCPVYGVCGGCNLQHISYTGQTAEKGRLLREIFVRTGGLDALPQIQAAAPWEYRNRMQFHRAGARAGLKARRGKEVIALGDCPVADPGIRGALRQGGLKAPPDKERFTVYSRGDLFLVEGVKPRGKTEILGKGLTIDGGVFFQSNAEALEALIPGLLAALEDADPSLPGADVYCGVGTMAAFLQERFGTLDLVEENPLALDLARKNVKGEGIRCFRQRAEDWAAQTKRQYGFMVADPPREGLHPAFRRFLAEKGPPIFVYISCDPVTLARDSAALTGPPARIYTLKSLKMYDFYPQTSHIESMAVFRREGA